MTARIGVLGSVAFASFIALSGCGNTAQLSPPYIGVAISPRPASLPVGASVVFTGTVSNNLSQPQWSILDQSYSNNPGALAPVSGSATSIQYTAPATPPIYSQTPTGITQGTITISATTTSPPGTSVPIAGDSVSFFITAPSVTVSLSPATANVLVNGGTQQFIGYAVGSVNNALTWYVNNNNAATFPGYQNGAVPVPMSNPTTYTYPYGSINTAGTYVAPASKPSSGSTVTITIVSQADTTKTASATVTLQ